jgi:hypothetical protein
MKTNYFEKCRSLEEVKKKYKELAMLHHPDKGGTTATMQEINLQYKNILKNPFFDLSDISEEDKNEFIKYPDIIDKIIGLHGLKIELIGNWIWISGNTFIHKDILKKTGFFFAPKKVLWYYRPAEYKSTNTKPKSIDEIRNKYGSNIIENSTRNNLLT